MISVCHALRGHLRCRLMCADCGFTGFKPPAGQSVVTVAKYEHILSGCNFTGSYADSGEQGLVGSYNASAFHIRMHPLVVYVASQPCVVRAQ
jgi:hypothetical protein